MRKFIINLSVIIITTLILILFYLSTFGIKTKKFNSFINEKVNEFNSKIKLETGDIFLKINLIERNIKINTNRSRLKINEELIYLSEININLDLLKFIQNENSIKKLNIVSEINQIKSITNFINNYKFNIPRLIFFNQINDGVIQASANILFDKEIKNGFSLEINGTVKDASLDILSKDQINNINFDFYVKDNSYNISDIKFDHQNIKFNSDQIEIKKLENNFFVKGNIKNQKGSINLNNILKFVDLNLDFIKKEDKILIESDTNFAFKLKKNRSIDNLTINSNINFDKVAFNNNIKNFLHLKNGNIKTKLDEKNLKIIINSEYYLIDQDYTDKIEINLEKKNNEKIKVDTKFKTEKLKINTKDLSKHTNIFGKFIKNQIIILDSDNNINFSISNKNKLEELKVYSLLKIDQFNVNYTSNKIRNFLPKFNDKVIFKNNNVELDYSNTITSVKANGNYSIDKKLDNYKISFKKKKKIFLFDTFFTSENNLLTIDEIDYIKKEGFSSNINLKGIYQNSEFEFDNIIIEDNQSKLLISKLYLTSDYKVNDVGTIELNYLNKNKNKNYLKLFKTKNNYQLISDNFDGNSLVSKLLKGDSNKSFLKVFRNLNSEINLSLEKFGIDKNSYLTSIEGYLVVENNQIKTGKIDAYLNKNNKFSYNLETNSNNAKITKILIEEPAPFIKNYKFIKGFEKGNLVYNSIEKYGMNNSTIRIYNFKVKEVPLLAKLLSLASLQGIADLLTGEGIRFDEFEMQYDNNKNLTTFNEIYAIGPAISILMEGYVEKDKLVSLRGTLVPATTINKTIAKIPLLGEILVGKDIGEGVFGVSFKIKGTPKNLKTSVNPVKTLTPRFITRTLEKLKRN